LSDSESIRIGRYGARVDVNELIQKAWEAVEKAGVPEPVQGVALKEAIDFLRDGGGSAGAGERSPERRPRKRAGAKGAAGKGRASESEGETADVDEAEFFQTLASESGVDENRLRDCLQVTSSGTVHVTPPARKLGDSRRAQAQRVVALVAGARSRGLGENPVNAEAVHAEIKRKHAWDANNFSNKHLGPMKGFNAGSDRTEIVLTSTWVDEFEAAVDFVLGDRGDGSDE
jgi:hypothetical protein